MKTENNSSHIDTIDISIPAKPEFLKIIRAAVSSICEVRGFCKDDLNNVILAVDESCSNIIKHAYGGPTDKPIQAKINICREKFEIYLRDFGKKADHKKIKPRNLDDVRPGGLGVHFIKTVMDEVVYDNSFDKGNQLKLVKKIKQK
ncbi:ATP-binding protein [candidate division KSB1 bacterium]|nr:ATP-binding protein [candidate division KSB1 bacterium]